jgi:exosortase
MTSAAPARAQQFDPTFGGAWPLVLGFAVLAIPTLVTLGQQSWSTEAGGHGPIVLATGAWLLWRQAPQFRREAVPGNSWLTGVMLAVALAAYVFGRAYDYITLQAGGVYGVGVAMLHARYGLRLLLKNWFPFFYLAFAIPPPTSVLDAVTSPLKHFVTMASTSTLGHFGLPVGRQGVTIFVAQYQMLVEDACSGMNSLIGLTAISLFYVYLLRGSSLAYSLLLTCFIIPIAIVANIIRIMVLILLTYFFGDAVAQGFLHFTAGIFLFATALALVFALDRALFAVVGRRLAHAK